MPIDRDKELKNIGNILIAKVFYDMNTNYDSFDFLRTNFQKRRETIKKFNKAVYGKK